MVKYKCRKCGHISEGYSGANALSNHRIHKTQDKCSGLSIMPERVRD